MHAMPAALLRNPMYCARRFEVARLEALARALVGEIRGAEAMLNASRALEADTPVPPLTTFALSQAVPSWPVIKMALTSRPELAAGLAEITRAEADVQVMRDMYKPMATVRTGPSYTMAEGRGWMAMVGLSLPIWRGKLKAGVAEAQAMRSMAEADLRAMTRDHQDRTVLAPRAGLEPTFAEAPAGWPATLRLTGGKRNVSGNTPVTWTLFPLVSAMRQLPITYPTPDTNASINAPVSRGRSSGISCPQSRSVRRAAGSLRTMCSRT